MRKVKEYNSSVAPFLAAFTGKAIADSYEWDGTPIRFMVSANMRKYYDTNTMMNFSDATFLSYDKTLAALPMEEQTARLRRDFKKQLTKEHFDPIIAQKTRFVRGFSDQDVSVAEWNRRFTQQPGEGVKPPMTVALTYPGSLDMPKEYAPLLKEVTRSLCSLGVNVSFCVFVSTYGDTMYIRSCQRFDSDAVMERILKSLLNAGLSAKMTALERYYGNRIIADRLQHI